MPMHIHLLMKKQSNLQVSRLVTNFLFFFRGFYGLKGLPNFFTKRMSTFFKTLIEQSSALVYIDGILLLPNSKEQMFHLKEQLHNLSTKTSLKLAPEKTFFMLLEIKFLGHEIGYNTIKPINSLLQNLPILLALIQNIHLPLHKLILLQISYKILFAYAFPCACPEQFLTNSTNIHIQESKSLRIHFLSTITFHILTNGFYTNTSI